MQLELLGVTWAGPPTDDPSLLAELPSALSSLLRSINGFILFGGCLHVRGAVLGPAWHSLRRAWRSDASINALYGLVDESAVPFAQDCVGDQYLLRDGIVWVLSAETAEVATTSRSLAEFLTVAVNDPTGTLQPEPLLRFQNDGGELAPGRLLLAYPPFCTEESAAGVSIKDVPCDELIRFHADLARQIAAIPDGGQFRVSFEE